jgi:hypothetical protein
VGKHGKSKIVQHCIICGKSKLNRTSLVSYLAMIGLRGKIIIWQPLYSVRGKQFLAQNFTTSGFRHILTLFLSSSNDDQPNTANHLSPLMSSSYYNTFFFCCSNRKIRSISEQRYHKSNQATQTFFSNNNSLHFQ